jgi:nucleoid DNA-binding protein
MTVNEKALANKNTAKKLGPGPQDRFVRQESFYDHLNQTVFKPVLGIELSRQAVKDIVCGIADQVSIVVLSGGKVRLGRLGTFMSRTSPAGPRYNPQTKSTFQVPERVKLVFRVSKVIQKLFD